MFLKLYYFRNIPHLLAPKHRGFGKSRGLGTGHNLSGGWGGVIQNFKE